MGKKLDWTQEVANADALYEFYHECNREKSIFETQIEVRRRDQDEPEFFCDDAKVHNVYDNSTMKIDILWEDFGYKNFRDLGLFGYYATKWCMMEYLEDIRAIDVYSQDSNKVVRIFAI